ncbi:protein virilizer [Malaya genurostris]|uniref:protein virilizer n=1 Tax=Malaya genurostris TaxID=325434 RepID=UPI0026F3AE5E|nr:protein virilizer [Malaya genurostris]XP_058444920.1 protein virilizer [Malaya genurostris]
MDEETPELLFFDTFSHDTYEKLNLDLVQFPKPVYITEVRIIPLGARVQADFPGGVRLGATNPSQFKIELFVNDLGKPGAPTFECLGDFEYNQNNCIHLECGKPDDGGTRPIPTDGLVLKGFYTTITLAVYGILTANIAEPIVSPREATPQPDQVLPVEIGVVDSGPGGIVEVAQEWLEEPAPVVPTEVFVQKEYPEADGEDIPKDPRPYARRVAAAAASVGPIPTEPISPKQLDCEVVVEKRTKRVSRSTDRQMQYEPMARSRGRSHEYSRSPSLCKDYQTQKRDWSRSPDYGSRSRRIRSNSYDRVRRGSSYDLEKDDRRRPRSPIDSPRRPRSPDPLDSSNDYDDADYRYGSGGHKYDKRPVEGRVKATAAGGAVATVGSPVSATATPVASPALLPEEDALSATEQFEPILSDEDIADDYDYDMEYDFAEEYYKSFNPFTAVLTKFEPPQNGGDVYPLPLQHLENVLKNNRYNAAATVNFAKESGDFKEGFVHYTDQMVMLLTQLFQLPENRTKFERVMERWTSEKAEVVELMLNCIKLGLNIDLALTQPQPAYKLRHLKAGIRLVELLGSTNVFIRVVLAQTDFNIFDKLLGLCSQRLMALSIKLMIIRSIYACLDTMFGCDYFLSDDYNGYQILLHLIQENPSTRISFALKSLLKKINLYENLDLLRNSVSDLYTARCDASYKPDPATLLLLENCVGELTKALTWDAIAYSQPKRFLPVSAKFAIHKDISCSLTANRSLVTFFHIHRLIDTIIFLLEMKPPSSSLVGSVYDLLAALLRKQQKLHYLMEQADRINVLLKILFQHCPPPLLIGEEAHPEDVLHELTRGQMLGLEMAYKLQTVYYLDAIGNTRDDLDKLVEYLQSLFHLANSIGKRYVVEVICMEDNMKLFLNLIEKEKRALNKEGSPGVKHKSPVLSYSVDLVDCAVRNCDHVGYLARHGESLLNLAKQHEQFESSVSAMLQEMAVYLKPLEIHEIFSYEDINPLVELMKRSFEFITTFPGDLITALRLLRYLGISEYDEVQELDHTELKYKYTILQFYSADGKSLLISILEKLYTYFDQPAIHASSLASMQGVLLTQILTPLIQILRKLMTYLIECRNTEFKDLTVIEPLLRTYALMQSVPISAAAINDAREIQKDIIRILLTFTQPTPTDGLDTNNIHKSLWTQMIGELIKFILYGPNYFIPGLLVFSELLPLPLPIQCRQELTPIEISKLVNERQLWSAHLHPQSPSITEMIQTICPSSYTPLLVIFSRVCLQLSDLAPNMTLLISKAITDLILQEPLLPGGLASTAHARLFSFLGSLVCHASVKVSVLSILPGRIMELMSGILLNSGQTPAHQQTQENIYIVFQNLLDSEFAMMFGNIAPIMQLACSLPSKEIIESCCSTIVENLSSEDTGVGVLAAVVRTMLLLTEHDITLTTLLVAMEKRKDSILSIVQKLIDKAALPDNSSDTYRPIFVMLVEFWRSLVTIDETALVGFNLPKRSIKLTPEQLGNFLCRKSIKKEGQEPPAAAAAADVDCGLLLKALLVIYKTEPKPTVVVEAPVETSAATDEVTLAPVIAPLDTLEENLAYLVELLKDTQPAGTGECPFDFGNVEPLPQAEGIVTQYASRSVFIISEEFEDQLKASYWLSFSPCDEDLEREQVPCDLQELAKMCLSGDINLTSECKRLLHLSASPHSHRDRVTTAPCFRTRRVEVEPSTGRPEKKIFATPLRGRGFTRAPVTRGDLFRSRPPNTSRPPSLHVDDFLALETCGAQPTGPTGYNKLSRDIITIRGSGRGRGRSFSDRTRPSSGWGQSSSSGGGGSGGGGGLGGSGSSWSQGHDGPSGSSGGGGGGGGSGKHFGSSSSSGHSHYREQSQNHFGAPHIRSRSGRGFSRYGGRLYSRPL